MLGMNINLIYKIFVVVCAICTAISMYICTKKISKSRYAGIVASFLYTTSGYRIITLVAKGFIGEVLSFIFVPIIILGLYEIIYNNEKKWWVFALGFIGLLNSNLVMTEIMIAISVLFIIFNIKKIIIKKTRLYAILKATIISLLVTLMLWLPMLEQLQKSTFKMKELVNVYNPKRWLLEPLNMFKGTVQYRDNLASAYGLGIIFVAIIIYVKYNKKKCFEKEIPKYIKTELKSKNNEYCLCIPIYNEGERICKELQKANDVNLTKVVDIVLLDGGSTDGTTDKKVLDKYNVNTIIEMEDKGVYKQSEALKAGFDFSIKRKYLGVITVDGNNKDSIEKVPDFIKKLEEGYDYIQGSRYLTGGKEVNTPNVRNFAIKYIHAPIISFICNKKYTDTTNLFRGYSIRYLEDEKVQIFRKIFKSYELSTYLSTRADQIGLKTCEIPVERIYPDKKNFSTKVGKIRGNILLLKILFENLFGKFDP